jgi:hypothetical protein
MNTAATPRPTTITLAATTVGRRPAEGTDWPVNVSLDRYAPAGRRPVWTLTVTCRGIAEGAQGYSRKVDAMAAYGRKVANLSAYYAAGGK